MVPILASLSPLLWTWIINNQAADFPFISLDLQDTNLMFNSFYTCQPHKSNKNIINFFFWEFNENIFINDLQDLLMRNLFISGTEPQRQCLDVVKTIIQMFNGELNKAMFRLA